MGLRLQNPTVGIAVLGLAFLAAKPLINPVPLLIWNASESVPIGWYLIARRQPKIGEIAVIRPSEWVQNYASARGYLPQEVLLLKPVLASNPSIICRFGPYVFVDGKHVVKAAIMDNKHRFLPVWKGCKALKPSQYFVLGRRRDSFDSRYFGPIDRGQVVGTAFPLADLIK